MVEGFNNWLIAFKEGKRKATQILYEEYRPSFVQWMSQKQHCTEEEAIDLFQDSLIVLYKNAQLGKLDNLNSHLKTYLFGIGKNMYMRKIRRQKEIVPESSLFSLASSEIGAEKQLQSADRKKIIAQLLKQMQYPCQHILYLFFYRRYSIEAIQKDLKYRSPEVVSTQKRRCIKALQKQLVKKIKKSDI